MRRLAWGVLLLMCGCSSAPGPGPAEPASPDQASVRASDTGTPDDPGRDASSDAGTASASDDRAGDWCAAAEARLEELDCRDPRGDPMWVNRRGERFRDTCRVAQDQGGIFLNPECIARAQSCEEASACPAP